MLLEKEPDSFDLDLQASNQARTVMANVCERLFQIGPDLTSVPQVVFRWATDSTPVTASPPARRTDPTSPRPPGRWWR
ncbi:hypothetical protein AB0O67_12785 [Streptomyces sp. NPDC086077]|uniref:hypothetical protein n=1 Tax=Streptomyces sp. NPDC086077 TaxID=3154862 RepID=UPI00343C0473